ncbi:helix-turn-helix domain-containing protein [Flavobacterium sp.]|jgi:excisionase family DNA binding protein|uniref:helix-turn-helix domain-containing protein n=1 Tax=Flavobacterium sp. TaxID=239 RepID=UPI0033415081
MNKEQVPVSDLLPQIFHHINVVVRSSVKEAMEQISKNKSSKEPNMDEDFLSAEQAASFLKIKLNTIYSKVEKGELPYSRSGKRKLLFSKKELERYIANRKVKSNDEIKEEVENYIGKK